MKEQKIHFQVGKSYSVANLVDDVNENKKNRDTEKSEYN